MNPRTTGILFLAAAALGAFIYFYEIQGEAERAEAEEATKRLFPEFSAEDVTEVALRTSDGLSARAVRGEEGWQLVEPLSFPADGFALDGVAAALADLSSESEFEDPQAPAVYGLDDDSGVVRFVANGASHELRLGRDAPMGSSSYASVDGSEAVYTVSTFARNAMRKSLLELREKRVARFDRNAIDRIVVSWPGTRVELEKGDDGWRITAPIEDRADTASVDSLLSDLSFLRADGFMDAPGPDEQAAFAEPAFEVELRGTGSDGALPIELSIAVGSDVGGDTRLVRGAQTSLYRVSRAWVDDVPRTLVAYRWKELAAFAPTDVSRVEVEFQPRLSTEAGDGPLTITALRGETGWTSEPETFGPGKLAGLVTALSDLTASNILADGMGAEELGALGLEPPIARIVIRSEEEGEPLAALRFGVVRGSEGITAQREGHPTVFEVDYELAERVPVSLEAFRNRFVAEELPDPEPAPESAEPELLDPALESP